MDKVIDAIKNNELTEDNVSFQTLRNITGYENNESIWRSLGYGRNILETPEQLDQYVYSYGLMIQSQWNQICKGLSIDEGKITLLDYGCGQGLASLLLLESIEEEFKEDVGEIILMEPSEVALDRAEFLVKICYPQAEIRSVYGDFDSISSEDLITNDEYIKIHLFSNVLDIDGFDHFELIRKLGESKGIHYFIAVSHDRDFEGGATRLEELFNAFVEHCPNELLESRLERYTCSGKPAIGFVLKLEF